MKKILRSKRFEFVFEGMLCLGIISRVQKRNVALQHKKVV